MITYWLQNMDSMNIQLEGERNRLLRRADWRFLLPNPHPARSVCLAGGLLRRSVALISGSIAAPQAAPAADCDLAVVVNPSIAALRRAAAMLRPGGACYVEQYNPLGGHAGLRRRLEAGGFTEIACYWPWPAPIIAPAQFWFPLDAPGALRYFLAQRAAPRGRLARLGRALRQSLWLIGIGADLALPICAVARKPGPDPAPLPDTFDLDRTTDHGWDEWGLGARPKTISRFLMTGGARSTNKIVSLVFAEPETQPRLAIKMARVPEAATTLLNEAAALRALQHAHPDLGGVPRVLFCQTTEHTLALGETAISGLPVFTHLRRGTYRALAEQATDWQIALAGRAAPAPKHSWWDRLVAPVLDDFRASFGAVADAGQLQLAHELLTALDDLPLVCEQRDFGPWNVLLTTGDAIGVLDWESAEMHGLPALDLIYFLTYLALFYDGAIESGQGRASYRMARGGAGLTGQVFHGCLERYAAAVGVERAALPALRMLAWMLHARSEHRRMVADAGGPPTADVLRRSLFLGLWEEELCQYMPIANMSESASESSHEQ
jgi:hypothetical protein